MQSFPWHTYRRWHFVYFLVEDILGSKALVKEGEFKFFFAEATHDSWHSKFMWKDLSVSCWYKKKTQQPTNKCYFIWSPTAHIRCFKFMQSLHGGHIIESCDSYSGYWQVNLTGDTLGLIRTSKALYKVASSDWRQAILCLGSERCTESIKNSHPDTIEVHEAPIIFSFASTLELLLVLWLVLVSM